ncbi:SAM-dependent chlorinase/fluorinase [Oculatella sp. LEGE 06141]|uniref:SAM hydrolase/SAM-dependent halogenase family protein n=1 Tax=Oculatella sp. LEGE 06141 TaxID=1828648 RepID=UPI0018805FB7|nr:SAM-dependent chlorinase/fluorinase [Oculatella sp. LEGE 06141]MBE9179592.1 SAM-dependent chlorinase/fluorinase [Oculatella sp. LEGE 06141]
MSTQPLLTLLSDFGLQDGYVGMMKGVIAHINPAVRTIDLTHQIPPQNIAAARFVLMNAYPFFPAGTVHVAIVDPGVGSARRAIALHLADGSFVVGPDNGLFSGVLMQRQVVQAAELTNTRYWRRAEPSTTFHGRDIFAPVGAHLASGVSLGELGSQIDPATLVQFPISAPTPTRSGFAGTIQYIDRFGNAITTIPGDFVKERAWSVATSTTSAPGCRAYSDVAPGQPLALIGSHGWVELAVNEGDARSQLRLSWHSPIEVVIGIQGNQAEYPSR